MKPDEDVLKKKSVMPMAGADSAALAQQKASSRKPQSDYVSGEKLAAVVSGATEDVANSWRKGDYGRVAGRGVSGLLATVPAAFIDAARDVAYYGEPIGRHASGFVSGLFHLDDEDSPKVGVTDSAGNAPVKASMMSSAYAKAPPVSPADPVPQAQNGVPKQPDDKAVADIPAARRVAKGVYQHGRGQFSDKAEGMGFGSFTGLPNAQNSRAADALALRSQRESMARVLAAQGRQQAPRVSAPSVAHSGNDWQRQLDLRKAKFAADSAVSQARGFGPRKAAAMLQNDPSLAHYRALLEQDNQARGLQAQAGLQTMAQNAQSQRQAAGINVDLERLGLEAERFGLQRQQAAGGIGLQNLQANLMRRYAEAKEPKEQEAIGLLMERLFGKGAANNAQRYIRVGGGQVLDPKTMEKLNAPDRLIDLEKQQEVFF